MTQQPLISDGSADISACGTYRYSLERVFRDVTGPRVAWLCLNPSTGDATNDDPSLRKMAGFSRRNGFAAMTVVNLFAYRATKPGDCRANLDVAVGPENDGAILDAVVTSAAVICAWGAHVFARARADEVTTLLRRAPTSATLLCLGVNGDGSPRHPLLVPYAQPLVPFVARRSS